MLNCFSRIYDYTSESDFVLQQMGSEIFHSLKKSTTIGLSTVGDEGGFAQL
jgi:enolase